MAEMDFLQFCFLCDRITQASKHTKKQKILKDFIKHLSTDEIKIVYEFLLPKLVHTQKFNIKAKKVC